MPISTKWQKEQSRYRLTHSARKVVSSKWSAKCITRLLRFEHNIWDFRNEIQAIVAAEEKEERDEKKRIENIKKEFHYGVAGLRERDHYMIEGVSEETLLGLPAEEQTVSN